MPNMEQIFQRLNTLIWPEGRLLVLDGTRPESLHTNVAFGSLPVWWEATEPFRKVGIFAHKSEYDRLLRKTGFSGIELEVSSSEFAEFADFSMMSSTSIKGLPQPAVSTLKVLILLQSESEISHLFTRRLTDVGVEYSICQLHTLDAENLAGRTCISLLEADRPILNNLDGSTFQKIQELFIACSSLLWVLGDPLIQPGFHMATGLLRTIRWEQDHDNLNVVSLSLDGEASATVESNVNAIFRVFQHQFLNQGPVRPSTPSAEYRVRNQLIETNHLVKNPDANTAIDVKLLREKPTFFQWDDIKRPVRLTSPHPGVDSLVWNTDEDHARQPMAEYEIEIDVCAVGLNFKDLLVAMGEIALTFQIAADLPVIYGTVIYSLAHIARLRAGEKVLIHAAAGGIGQAAIQYAKVKNTEIFVTLSSIEKKEFIKKIYRIPKDHIFFSRGLNFSREIKDIAPVVLMLFSTHLMARHYDNYSHMLPRSVSLSRSENLIFNLVQNSI